MRNSYLAPPPSQRFSFGNNEFRMASLAWDISSILDSRLTNSLWSLPNKLFSDEDMRGANLGINHPQTGYTNTKSSSDRCAIRTEQPHGKVSKELNNERKRPLEAKEQKSATEEEKTAPSGCEWKKNKRKRTLCPAPTQHFLPHPKASSSMELHESKVTVKKSQKIGDRITALQKLVSPYGKTDTASVLQEASLYIKLLQDQVQNLFQMLSSSYSSIKPLQLQENGKEQTDLRSRGLCLVPVSSIQEAAKETNLDNQSTYRHAH